MTSAKISKEIMTERIIALQPCHERHAPGTIARWMAPWPERLSARDVLRLSAGVVSDADRLWVAWRLAPKPVRDACARLAVLRAARVYAAAACERVGLSARAATLRALPDDASYQDIRTAASAAANAAYAAANATADAAYAAANATADAADAAAANAAYAAANATADAATAAADAARAADATAAERAQQITDLLNWREGL